MNNKDKRFWGILACIILFSGLYAMVVSSIPGGFIPGVLMMQIIQSVCLIIIVLYLAKAL